jgi:Dyp-type peroxidase family
MELALRDVQGNVVPGFNKDHQAFLFVRFREPAGARQWLAGLLPELASAYEVNLFRALFQSIRQRRERTGQAAPGATALPVVSATWLNLGLSASGLGRLLDPAIVARFGGPFRANRVPGVPPSEANTADAVLIVAADEPVKLDAELGRQRQRLAACALDELACLRGDTLPGPQRGHEHFGFKDGVSQPRLSLDSDDTWTGRGPEVAPGEFVLGLPDTSGRPSGAGLPSWVQNGSFLAFVQMEQHVGTFWAAMQQHAPRLGTSAEALAASIVGRTRSGELVSGGTSQPPATFSHIGRAYARQLGTQAAAHRILRRGIPYGPPWQPGDADDGSRGLLFVAYQADLGRQFEHVWDTWLNSPAFPTPGAGRDGLVGQLPQPGTPGPLTSASTLSHWTPSADRPAAVPAGRQPGGPIALRLPVFVTPRRGAYFFAPSLAGVAFLSQRPPRAQQPAPWRTEAP